MEKKKIKIEFHYTESGYIEVEAETKEDASAKVYKYLEANGVQDLDRFGDTDVVHREYNTYTPEE